MRSGEGRSKKVTWLVVLLCTLAYICNADDDFFSIFKIRQSTLDVTDYGYLTVMTLKPKVLQAKAEVLTVARQDHVLRWMKVAADVPWVDAKQVGGRQAGGSIEIFTAPPFDESGEHIYIFRSTTGQSHYCKTILQNLEASRDGLKTRCISAKHPGLDGVYLGYLIPDTKDSTINSIVKKVKQHGELKNLPDLELKMLQAEMEEEYKEGGEKQEKKLKEQHN